MENFGVWFDIPVKDMDRAIHFYSKVFAVELNEVGGPEKRYAMFPFEAGMVSGGLVEDAAAVSDKGVRLYLKGTEITAQLARVTEAGGEVVQEKTSVGANGYMALFKDCEGNLLALHSPD